MHRSKAKYGFVVLFLLCITEIYPLAFTLYPLHYPLAGEEASTWKNIVNKATEMTKDAGVPGAGDICGKWGIDGDSSNTCKFAKNNEGEGVEVTILECNPAAGGTLGRISGGVGVCQVKSWIVSLSFALIIIMPLIFLACICCCCCGMCCCCRSYAPLKPYRP